MLCYIPREIPESIHLNLLQHYNNQTHGIIFNRMFFPVLQIWIEVVEEVVANHKGQGQGHLGHSGQIGHFQGRPEQVVTWEVDVKAIKVTGAIRD